MTVRTIDDLNAKLSNELIWRKRELSDLKYYIEQPQSIPTRLNVLARCGVAILYAHWEGFVRLAGRYYLEFVTNQRLSNRDLNMNLLTLSMRKRVAFSPSSLKYSQYGRFTKFFSEHMGERANIPYKSAIDTQSNLSSGVLREIVWCLGIDYAPYETKEKFIDSRLLERRNYVAHGQSIKIDSEEYVQMRDIVIEMMESIKTQLENSAAQKHYKI